MTNQKVKAIITCRSKKIPIIVSKLSMLVSYLLFLSIILEKQDKYEMQHSSHAQSHHLQFLYLCNHVCRHREQLDTITNKVLCW